MGPEALRDQNKTILFWVRDALWATRFWVALTMQDKKLTGSPSAQDPGLQKTLTLLECMKGTPEGDIYAAHLREILLSRFARHDAVDESRLGLARQLLAVLEQQLPKSAALDAQLNIIRLHLQPPVSEEDLQLVQSALAGLGGEAGVDAASLRDMFKPLIAEGAESPAPSPREPVRPPADELPPSMRSQDFAEEPPADDSEIKKIRDEFARQVDDAISTNQQFGVLLEVELDALQQASRIDDLEERRRVLIQEVEKFVGRHRSLSHKFDTASKYLKIIESDNQHLNDELDRVRMLSLTDELTALPNRRAFMKRLEDEVGRVNRYGYPISLVLIDLDEFKSINDIHGHAAGDAVLRCYAEYVLSAFRHHDMVARYGGEEFSVILPNTREEGAMRALAKAQDYAAQTYCMHNGERLNMPTFSAGLAEYRQGELPAEFIERADAALYRAKHTGRNRIEIASNEEGSGGASSRQA